MVELPDIFGSYLQTRQSLLMAWISGILDRAEDLALDLLDEEIVGLFSVEAFQFQVKDDIPILPPLMFPSATTNLAPCYNAAFPHFLQLVLPPSIERDTIISRCCITMSRTLRRLGFVEDSFEKASDSVRLLLGYNEHGYSKY